MELPNLSGLHGNPVTSLFLLILLKDSLELSHNVFIDDRGSLLDILAGLLLDLSLEVLIELIPFKLRCVETLGHDGLNFLKEGSHLLAKLCADGLPEVGVKVFEANRNYLLDLVTCFFDVHLAELLDLLLSFLGDSILKALLKLDFISLEGHGPISHLGQESLGSFLEALHAAGQELSGVLVELVIDCIILASQLDDALVKVVMDHLGQGLELVVKADEQFLDEVVRELLLDFFEDVSLVLACFSLVVFDSFLQDGGAPDAKVFHQASLGFSLELTKQIFDLVDGFLFDLTTSIVSHHLALIGEVELLVVADHVPRLLQEEAKTINGYHLTWITSIKEHLTGFKFVPQLCSALFKFILLEPFMS